MKRQIRVTRFDHDKESTKSLVAINRTGDGVEGAEFFCYGLEDQRQEKKVAGETRIPDGEYRIGWQELDTPLTLKYRKRFPQWFKYHIHVKDVPDFTGIYIHIGNDDDDTTGCLLLGYDSYGDEFSRGIEGKIGKSTKAYQDFYWLIRKWLNEGDEVTIKYHSIYEK